MMVETNIEAGLWLERSKDIKNTSLNDSMTPTAKKVID
jgi:hypothetical protein